MIYEAYGNSLLTILCGLYLAQRGAYTKVNDMARDALSMGHLA